MESLLFLILVVFVLAALKAWLSSPLVRGALGERAVHRTLVGGLPSGQYRILQDVTLNTAGGTTQIDHVVVSPFGVFAIETKAMSGWIFGSERDAQWTQKFPRSSHRFQNPLRQNHAHVMALRDLLQLDATVVHSVVVFTGEAKFKTDMPPNVLHLGSLVAAIRTRSKQLISDTDVEHLVRRIEDNRLEPTAATRRAHIESLHERHNALTGAVDDARGLMRQGAKTLFAIRVASGLVVIGVLYFIATQALSAVGALLGTGDPPAPTASEAAAPRPSTEAVPAGRQPVQISLLPNTQAMLQKQRDQQAARELERARQAEDAWKATLMCGYSTDTMRCACYDPKGGKVPMEFEECRALADKR